MAAVAVIARAVADPHIAARQFLQHEGEVFRAHGRLDLVIDVGVADDVAHHVGAERGFFGMVDGGRVVTLEREFHFAVHGGAGMPRDLSHTAFDQVQHFQRERAHGAAQFGVVGHDVVGAARVDLGDAEHGRVQRIAVARDDGLQGLGQLHGRHDRVDAQIGHASVRALALHDDGEFVAGRHDGAGGQAELAGLHAGPVVHAEHRFHGEAREQAVVDHALGAAAAFLGGLEDDIDRAGVVAVLRQVARRSQQHGGVAVMATGVHLAVVLAGMRERVDLLHGQRVHVGAQAHGAVSRLVAADDPDDARAAQPAMDFDAPFFKLRGHHVGRAEFLEGQFGMRVDVASNLGNVVMPRDDGFEEFHGERSGEIRERNKGIINQKPI
ncbi:hypothetical protein D9M68_565110 [compost metagenome]